jgi:hypothetical protein
MTDAGGQETNLKDHFEMTARGRDYLRLRAEMLATVPGPGESEELV